MGVAAIAGRGIRVKAPRIVTPPQIGTHAAKATGPHLVLALTLPFAQKKHTYKAKPAARATSVTLGRASFLEGSGYPAVAPDRSEELQLL